MHTNIRGELEVQYDPIIHETPSEIADSETMMQRAVVPDAEMACAVETRSQTVQYEKGEPYAFPKQIPLMCRLILFAQPTLKASLKHKVID